MLVEHNQRSTWRCPLRAPRDAPLGGSCGDTIELEGSEPTVDIAPHASRDIQMEFVRKHVSSSRSLGRNSEDIILPGHANPPKSVDPRHLGKSEWDQNLGKIQCVFSLYDQMRWKWDDVYLPRGLPNKYSPSLSPTPLPLQLCTPPVAHYGCTSRPWSSKLRDALAGQDQVNSEMQLEARIEWLQTYSPSLWSSEVGDAFGGRDRASSEMHLEAEIEWT